MSFISTMTPAGILTQAAAVPTEMGGVIVLVAGLSIGIFVVSYLIGKLRNSTY